MNDSPRNSTPWSRLARHAAEAPAEDETLPYGFATRVVAGWQAGLAELEAGIWRTRETFAWRGAAIAMAITLAAVALNYDLLLGLWSGDTALAGTFMNTFAAP